MQTEARVGQRTLTSGGHGGGGVVDGGARKFVRQQQQSQIGTVSQLLAGGIAGAVSKTCTAPLARLTILFQVQGMHSDVASLRKTCIWREASRIISEEGFRALWKGNLVTIAHRLPYSSISFYAYERYKNTVPGLEGHRENVTADLCVRLAGGGLAGITAASVTYPLDLVRTRLAAQTNVNYYKGIWHTLHTISREEGMFGLFKGLGATLLVYRRYKQYYQQLLAIIASFETVTGLGNAAPYTTFALKSMSKHFRCLKNAITDQLHFSSKDVGEGSLNRDHEHPKFGTTERHVHSHKPPHKSGILDHQHVWRPQRGLPERAVAVLRAWLFEHFLYPYPTDTDKQMLAKQTGLSRSQVSNWFINARVRLWKPMVEEIHMLETRESQKGSEPADQTDAIKLNEPLPTTNPSFSNEHPQTNLMQKDRDSPQKRIRNEPLHIPDRSNDQINFSYNISQASNILDQE